MNKFLLLLTLLLFVFFRSESQSNRLLPLPTEVITNKGRNMINSDFSVGFYNGTERLFRYTERILRRIDTKSGALIEQHNLGEKDQNENANLFIRVGREGELVLGEDESYSLEITSTSIDLKAETDIGAMRGLETLVQLLQTDQTGSYFPALQINDSPRFPWRGLLIDFGRHWIPLDVVKRNIDGMAMVKMNVLHLHLTEDQGFRIESKRYPKLHEMGSNGDYFTQTEIKELVRYAGNRGVRVVPEFDIPGHTASWFVGYPELASAPGPYQIATEYGVQDPVMDPTKEKTYQFLESFLDEMTELFPDEYVHIGGDENNGKQWNESADIQKYMQSNGIADNHELQSEFNQRVLDILQNKGKKMMGWDEILQPGISEDIMIQSWRGRNSMEESARLGYKTILSNGYYIDLMQPASFHYKNDPIPENSPLSVRDQDNIVGGEATMWTELVTHETIDGRIWPRTAAIAERLWSPADVTDVDDMYFRLDKISTELELVGLLHEKNVEMFLRRLSNNQDTDVLRILVDVIEPIKDHDRRQVIDYKTYTPFSRLADAVRPEAPGARKLSNLVNQFTSGNSEVISDLKDYFLLWIENHPSYLELVAQAPILKGSEKLSLDLSNISKIGLQALSKSVKHDGDWRQNANKTLDAAKADHAECELRVVESIRELVRYSK